MKIYQNCSLDFGQHGFVMINVRRNAVNVTLRRSRYGCLQATVPYGVDSDYLKRVLPDMIGRLTAKEKPAPAATDYYFGWRYDFPESYVTIVEQTDSPGVILPEWTGQYLKLGVHRDAIDNRVFISDCLLRCAGYLAPKFILPVAKEISRRLGVAPSRWEIGRGTRTLGTCHSSDRHISLSRALLFLLSELREYVICHELAHLTHADHSPAFHSLCNSYLCGREKELNRALKAFPWPILR